MELLNDFKPIFPCRHTWEFIQNGPDDAYFQCEGCHKQRPYDVTELADIEQEMNNGK